ncbi:HepT-like ribonuclease domain-containing protein [Roseburia intestinalis]|nr:HepT-like ribonuclease domain-containing protein [Roseburia intestinalis]
MRNRIVHDYEGVNLKLVWEIISDDLPELKQMLLEIK